MEGVQVGSRSAVPDATADKAGCRSADPQIRCVGKRAAERLGQELKTKKPKEVIKRFRTEFSCDVGAGSSNNAAVQMLDLLRVPKFDVHRTVRDALVVELKQGLTASSALITLQASVHYTDIDAVQDIASHCCGLLPAEQLLSVVNSLGLSLPPSIRKSLWSRLAGTDYLDERASTAPPLIPDFGAHQNRALALWRQEVERIVLKDASKLRDVFYCSMVPTHPTLEQLISTTKTLIFCCIDEKVLRNSKQYIASSRAATDVIRTLLTDTCSKNPVNKRLVKEAAVVLEELWTGRGISDGSIAAAAIRCSREFVLVMRKCGWLDKKSEIKNSVAQIAGDINDVLSASDDFFFKPLEQQDKASSHERLMETLKKLQAAVHERPCSAPVEIGLACATFVRALGCFVEEGCRVARGQEGHPCDNAIVLASLDLLKTFGGGFDEETAVSALLEMRLDEGIVLATTRSSSLGMIELPPLPSNVRALFHGGTAGHTSMRGLLRASAEQYASSWPARTRQILELLE